MSWEDDRTGRRRMTHFVSGGMAINSTLPTLEVPAEAWVSDALCPQVDADIFYVNKGGSTGPAKAICAMCPVAEQCLQYAIEHDERWGVWGGKSERERRAIKRAAA